MKFHHDHKVTVVGGKPNLKIDAIYAIVAQEDGDEGIMGGNMVIDGREMFVPLVGADEARIRSMMEYAKRISAVTGVPFRVYKFDNKTDITDSFV
jgi:hypothetical protein